MATDDSARRAPGGNPVLSRDPEGNEHLLRVVDHPAGLVTLFDGEIQRTMAPAAALELGILLITATKGHFRGIVGPISGGY